LTKLGILIKKHNLHEEVGITLLHRHFEITEDEVLLERFDETESCTEPVKISNLDPNLCVPHSFAFTGKCWEPFEYVSTCVYLFLNIIL
jgi:hypothetical protein